MKFNLKLTFNMSSTKKSSFFIKDIISLSNEKSQRDNEQLESVNEANVCNEAPLNDEEKRLEHDMTCQTSNESGKLLIIFCNYYNCLLIAN